MAVVGAYIHLGSVRYLSVDAGNDDFNHGIEEASDVFPVNESA